LWFWVGGWRIGVCGLGFRFVVCVLWVEFYLLTVPSPSPHPTTGGGGAVPGVKEGMS